MNPIYKTGWGQYVDLSQVMFISQIRHEDFHELTLMVGPHQVSTTWRKADFPEEWKTKDMHICALIMAWESYRNREV